LEAALNRNSLTAATTGYCIIETFTIYYQPGWIFWSLGSEGFGADTSECFFNQRLKHLNRIQSILPG
jgi:hypothetical protein